MGYSTFLHFLKDQFPNVRFHKDDVVKNTGESKPSHSASVLNGVSVQNRWDLSTKKPAFVKNHLISDCH